jgi:hypothetical protein
MNRSKEKKIYYLKNRDKILKRCKNYQKSNKEKVLEYQKNYRKLHKLEKSNWSKKYYQSNKVKIKKYRKEYFQINKKEIILFRKNRRINNAIVRITNNLRHRIYLTIKKNYKSKKTLELLGCSIEKLKKHLESKFIKGMSWANYGKWHLDHIKPCAKFDLSKPSEQHKCFNYINLQPLWAEENLRKSNKK